MIKHIQDFFEKQAFGVCTRLGEMMGISISSIRLFFIYSSFLALGSPILVYMGLVFIRNMRQHFRKRNNPLVWEL